MRLVDADTIHYDEVYVPDGDVQWEYKQAWSALKSDIDQLPTIEAEPIIHAKWTKMSRDGMYWYACSACEEEAPKSRWGSDYFSRRCPGCGAHMDIEMDLEEEGDYI